MSPLLLGAALAADLDVQIPTPDLTLEGTLSLPEGEGPFPGVVLVHGSGPNSRDEVLRGQLNVGFLRKVPVFEELSEALVAHGFAVLRYDKRSCGRFNKCAKNDYPLPADDLTIDVFMDDAAAALAWLGAHEQVSHVSVVGHSQGATFVPELLVEHPELHAGVVLAGTFRPIDQILQQQLDDSRALYQEMGVSSALADKSLGALQEMVDQVHAVRRGELTDPTQPISGATVGFFQSWLAQTDRMPALALQVTQPMLVLGGSMDTNVPPAEIALWRAHLPESQPVEVLDCLSHALTCISEPELSKIKPKHLGKHVDVRVPTRIAGFLSASQASDG